MPRYILDTDSFSLEQDGIEPISSRILSTAPTALFTTAITVDESLTGWYTLVRRSTGPKQLEFAYGELISTVQSLAKFQLLNFTQACSSRFDTLVRAKLNVKKNDLRIAAIALEHGAIVVTRNVRDFSRVSNLVVEDWMQP